MHLSYLEIYNEAGYIFGPRPRSARAGRHARVHVLEDEAGCIHMRNLSLHQTATEEEAPTWCVCGQLVVCTFLKRSAR